MKGWIQKILEGQLKNILIMQLQKWKQSYDKNDMLFFILIILENKILYLLNFLEKLQWQELYTQSNLC